MMYAVVDLEATPVRNRSEKRIIQIGITFIEDDTIQDTLCIDINPMTSIDARVVALTGITDEQVKDAPIFEDVAEYIYTLLDGCVFVAHNIHFDYTLLKEAFKSVGYDDFSMVSIDTIELAKIIYPTQESYNLGQLALAKQLLHPQEHHAGSDSRVTAELFLLMKQDVSSLPQQVIDNIFHVLRYKEDPHAFFFACSSNHIEKTADVTIKDCRDEETVPRFEATAMIQKDIMAYVQQSQHVLLEETGSKSDLEAVLPALYDSEHVMIYVSPHRQHTYDIEKILCEKNVPASVIYPIHYYINDEKLESVLENVSQLTTQEVRQLCRVLVMLHITDTPYQYMTSPEINRRLLYWIGGITQDGIYPKSYLSQLESITPRSVVIIEQQTLLEQIQLLQKVTWFDTSRFYIPNVYKWLDTVQKNTSMVVYHTNHMQQLFGLSQRIQDTYDTNKEQDLLQIDIVIAGYQTFLKTIQRSYPTLFTHTLETSYQTSFVDSVANIDAIIFKKFEKCVRVFKQLLEKYDRYKYKLHKELDDHITVLERLAEMSRAYLVLTTQRKKYVQYTLTVEQYSTQEWLAHTVHHNEQPVIYTKIGQFKTMLDSYLVNRLHSPHVHYVSEQENMPDDVSKNKIYVLDTVDTSVMKDNLIIKKIKTIAKKWGQPTICIVPSLHFLEKVLENNPEAYTVHMQQAWTKQNTENLYLTWEQWRQHDITVLKGQRVVILKLPFDSPYSVSAQAYQFYEHTKSQTYFERIALPKMLMQIYECAMSVTTKGGQIIVLDHRLVNSVYQDDVVQTLGRSFMLEKVDIASLIET